MIPTLIINPLAKNRTLQVTCGSYPRWRHGSKEDYWVAVTWRNYVPHDFTAEVESLQRGGYGGFRCVILSLVGLMGGLGMVFDSLASEFVTPPPSPAHEFVETTSNVDEASSDVAEASFLGCPARGRAAPLSLLLRYPRSFRDGSNLLSLVIVREGAGESLGVNYGQIVAERNDKSSKREMYTRDAWMGMRRLEQYGRLVDSVAEKEKLCVACVRNRRYQVLRANPNLQEW